MWPVTVAPAQSARTRKVGGTVSPIDFAVLVDHKLERRRIFDWQRANLGTAEDAIDIKRNAPE